MEKVEKIAFATSQNFKERDYWLKKLSGELLKSVFPYDNNVKNIKLNEDRTDVVRFRIAGELLARLTKMCSAVDAKLHVILAAGVTVLLEKYSGNQDIIIGIPIHQQEIRSNFINTVLALRNQIRNDMTFKEIIIQVHQSIFNAIENQNYPIETLLYLLNLPYSENDFPLFDIAVLLENIHDERYIQHIKLNLIFSFLRTGAFIEGTVKFNLLLYQKSTITRIIKHFQQLLQQSLFHVDIPLGDIDILTDKEKKQLLFDFNDTAAHYPYNKSIHDLLAAQVQRTLDQTALKGMRNIHFSYRELNKKSDQLAYLLQEKGVKPDTIVAIMGKRSIEIVIGILGILKAGGAYMPIDPDYPQERIKYMLADSKVNILVKDSDVISDLEGEQEFLVLNFEHLNFEFVSNFDIGLCAISDLNASNLSYVIYTSGTTGKPKGTLMEHRNVVRLMVNDKYLFDFNHRDVWTMFHSFCFDFSVWEMYGALLYGGKLVIIPKITTRAPGKYLEVLKKEKVTILNQTPSAFYGLITEELKDPGKNLYLRYIIFGGEALLPVKLKEWQEKYPKTRLINMYGITETTVHATFKEISAADIDVNVNTIGKPIPTLCTYIMDPHLKLLPPGVAGEICVGGVGVARGYLNQQQLTKEKFIDNPYKSGERLYRSGDLGRLMTNGEIAYMGRIDHQVKIRGFRIELEEIESQLLKYNEIKEVVVTAGENQSGDKYLGAYIVTGKEITISQIKEYLSRQLPHYMIPLYFVRLEKIPLTPNGKVNREKLPTPSVNIINMDTYAPPKNDMEAQLVEIWKRVLKLEHLGVKDNFFNVGGDSIKAIKLINSINQQLHTNTRINDLYLNETIEKLSAIINKNETCLLDRDLKNTRDEIETLKERIMAKMREGEKSAGLAEMDIQDIYPMSDIQKGMVYHSLKEPERAVYHDQMVHHIADEDFNPRRFKKAMTLMVEKHPILRTAFFIGQFEDNIQIVHKNSENCVDFEHYDISTMETHSQEAYIKKFIREDRKRPFNVSKPPLWRMRTFALDKNNIVVLWVFHHAIIDGWSDASFKTELNNVYLKLKTEPDFVPGKLKASNKDFIIEQIAYKKNKKIRDYWRRELLHYKRLQLTGTGHHKKEKTQEKGIRKYVTDLPGSLLNQLNDIAVKYNTNLKCLCFAAYVYMLNMLSYDNDITAGMVIHNRPLCEDGEKILGCFLNTIPVRMIIPPLTTWLDYIRMVDKKLAELAEYGKLSLLEIANIIGEEGRGQNPLFDTIFNFIDFHVYRNLQMGQKKQMEPKEQKGASQDQAYSNKDSNRLSIRGRTITNTLFNLNVDTTGGGLGIAISYLDSLFTDEEVERYCSYFKGILFRFLDDPEGLISKDKIISPQERQTLLYEFNNTRSAYPWEKTISELFEMQVPRTPDHTALVGQIPNPKSQIPNKEAPFGQINVGGENISITYKELNEKSHHLAHLLRKNGVMPDTIVAIMGERSIEMIIGIQGILKAGGAYMPIDPDYPQERITYMLKDSNARILLRGNTGAPGKSEIRISESRCFQKNPNNRNSNDQNKRNEFTVLNFEHLNFEFVSNFEFRASNLTPSKLAYIIYTSGTTGKPKGVTVAHQNAINVVTWFAREYNVTVGTHVLQMSDYTFDASVNQIFAPLLYGGELHIVKKELLQDIGALRRYIEMNHIHILNFVPGFLKELLTWGERLKSVHTVISGGEALIALIKESIIAKGYVLYNHYGPTEATIDVLSLRCGPGKVTLGRPIANARCYVLDIDGKLLPIGVAGELSVTGAGLARGYLNQPELTAEKFVKAVLGSSIKTNDKLSKVPNHQCLMTNGRLYRTGDLARWLSDGNIEFLGRIDHQVKIRGFRVELGEIESCLLSYHGVKEAVLVMKETPGGDKYLCAYVVPDLSETGEAGAREKELAADLKLYLSSMLPVYMIPKYVVPLKTLPLTGNGKLDRKLLPEPRIGDAQEYTAPKDEREKKLADIWSQVLGVNKEIIGIDDNFFDLGGHSLSAIILVGRIKKELGATIPLGELFQTPTLRGISSLLEVTRWVKEQGIGTNLQQQGKEILL
ncbi:MAG: amino acid adenylation domain-containing protein [Candidatus Aminicenantes bacterium]|jgi:surfactin family lipopeptide synthetase A